MLGFIDQIVFPILTSLYGSVGYLGVFLAMTVESAMIPLPSELILPFAGFLVASAATREPLTGAPWNLWLVVLVGTLGNTTGSLISYWIGLRGGRPLLMRYGKYLLIRPHEIELADRFFERWGAPTAFFSRLLPVVRTFISLPAGIARMPLRQFVVYSVLGALPWSFVLTYAGVVLGDNWTSIRHALAPFDTVMAVAVVAAIVLFVAWRLGFLERARGSRVGQ